MAEKCRHDYKFFGRSLGSFLFNIVNNVLILLLVIYLIHFHGQWISLLLLLLTKYESTSPKEYHVIGVCKKCLHMERNSIPRQDGD